MRNKILLLLSLFCLTATSFAVTDKYTFVDAQAQAQFYRLTNQLRCLVCQNESIADSHAELAEDLRAIVAKRVNQHQSDEEILKFLTERYGDFVLYQPPLVAATFILWGLPFAILIASLIAVLILTRKRKARG